MSLKQILTTIVCLMCSIEDLPAACIPLVKRCGCDVIFKFTAENPVGSSEFQEAIMQVFACEDKQDARENLASLLAKRKAITRSKGEHSSKTPQKRTLLQEIIARNSLKDDDDRYKIMDIDLFQKLLSSSGMHINRGDQKGKTALDYVLKQEPLKWTRTPDFDPAKDAVYKNRLDLVRSLMDAGSAMTLRDFILSYSGSMNYLNRDVLKIFLEAPQVDINHMDQNRKTALHAILEKSNSLDREELAVILIQHGAFITIRNSFNQTLLEEANGSASLQKKMKEASASPQARQARENYALKYPNSMITEKPKSTSFLKRFSLNPWKKGIKEKQVVPINTPSEAPELEMRKSY